MSSVYSFLKCQSKLPLSAFDADLKSFRAPFLRLWPQMSSSVKKQFALFNYNRILSYFNKIFFLTRLRYQFLLQMMLFVC